MTGSKAVCGALLALGLTPSAFAQGPGVSPRSSAAAPLPYVSLQFGTLTGTLDNAAVIDPLITYGGELTVRADRLQGSLLRQQYEALGHVRVHEADTTLVANTLTFDGARNLGVAGTALLTQRPFTLRARRIDVTPSVITAHDGTFTTAPPGTRPDLEARVGDLSLYPARRNGIMHQASVYLLHTRLITLRRISFNTTGASGSSRRQGVLPAVGVSGRYGPYLAYGGAASRPFPFNYRVVLPTRQTPQIRLTSQQPLFVTHRPQAAPAPDYLRERDYLGAIRKLATAPQAPLPEGDPLLFHGYLPEPDTIRPLEGPPAGGITLNEEVSTHVEATGRRKDNLYVYRLPEVAVNGSFPLVPVSLPPTNGDPAAYRSYLRRLVPIAFATAAYGYFEELPEHLYAARQSDSVGLTTRPLLVAPDTLFQPRLQYTRHYYSGRRGSYRFLQGSVQVNRYFTPYSGVSVQYLAASTGGDSPFNFDVLDTSQELRLRLEMGNRRLAVAGQVRFDLTHGGVYDYKLAVAPGLNGITPVFSYNFRNRSIGLGADIPGLTF